MAVNCRTGYRLAWMVLVPAALSCCNAPSTAGLFDRASSGGGGAGGTLEDAGIPTSGASGGGSGGMGTAGNAGSAGSGGSSAEPDALDAGSDAPFVAAPEAGTEAGPGCGGTLELELCWYLSAASESCNQTCESRGGFDERALAIIGAPSQGGSVEQCAVVLTVLTGEATEPESGTNVVALGCHLFGDDRDPWWLSAPEFSPDAIGDTVRIACACND